MSQRTLPLHRHNSLRYWVVMALERGPKAASTLQTAATVHFDRVVSAEVLAGILADLELVGYITPHADGWSLTEEGHQSLSHVRGGLWL